METTLADVRKNVDWVSMFLAVSAKSRGRDDYMHEIAVRMCIPYGTLRNKFYAWKKNPDTLVDRRRVRRYSTENKWLQCYLYYIEKDKNTSIGGYRAMMVDFRSGALMPHLNKTWQMLYREEFPDRELPPRCPEEWDWIPRGATYQNLQNLAKRDPHYQFSIMASRKGMAAARQFVRSVLTTREGLMAGQKYEFDDVWHNVDIHLVGGEICQPLEFAGYDIASGYKVMSCMKPRFMRADGKRDNLKEFQFLCGLANLLMREGFHRDGVELVVEHGTTAVRETVEKQIRGIGGPGGIGELINFTRSGILSDQVHEGLFAGMGGGNFRIKAFCEGAHNVLHNREASLIGNKGRDAEHLHESHPALVKYEEKIARIAATLPEEFRRKLMFNLLSFDEYNAAFRLIEARLMDDPWHRLQGWGNRTVCEWRMSEGDMWKPYSALDLETPARRDAIATLVGGNPNLVQRRPMSRREAWVADKAAAEREGKWVRVEDWFMPYFVDPAKHGKWLTVRPDGRIGFRDELYYGPDEVLYRANVKDYYGRTTYLTPGKKILCVFNPFMPEKVWVMDQGDGHILGTCGLDRRAPMNDPEAIRRAMGEQAHEIAVKAEAVRGRHLIDAMARATAVSHNRRVINAGIEAASRGLKADGEGYALEDLNGAAIREEAKEDAAGENADALAFLDAANAV